MLSIADYADKYTQLIDQLCEEFDIDFKAPLKINLEVASDKQADLPHQINEFFFLKRCDYLYKLSKEIAEASVAQYCQDPVEKIMKAFENIGKTSNINYSDGINTPWIGKKSNLLSDE
ncbi:MAG TPA: hypothetical protein DDY32_16530 [Desulfobulbaceae bacterium]|nr:hypothetical protein [Desulfobulbaceae bacterium]